MAIHRSVLAAGAVLAAACAGLSASAQALNAGQCIVAGRVTDQEKWAPRFEGVQLLAPNGRVVTAAGRQALADVQQVRLTRPAVLSRCDGDGELARADDLPSIPKEPMPALSPGVVDVEAVAFPKLRTGGQLVELRVKVPLDRVVMVSK